MSVNGGSSPAPKEPSRAPNLFVPSSPALPLRHGANGKTLMSKKSTRTLSKMAKGRTSGGGGMEKAPFGFQPSPRINGLQIEGKRASLTSAPNSRRGSSAAGSPTRSIGGSHSATQYPEWSPKPPSQARPLSHPRQKPDTPPPSFTRTYLVGGAVVNPNLNIAPSVQKDVKVVDTPEDLRTTPPRSGIGAILREPRRSSRQPGITAEGLPSPPSIPSSAGEAPVLEIIPKEKSTPLCVETLHKLYGTTVHDVVAPEQLSTEAFANTIPRSFAREILPELLQAESKAEELASVRRLIDWTVTIPTAETVPPPSIAFLDGEGQPMPHVTTLFYTLDSLTGDLQLTDVLSKDSKYTNGGEYAASATTSGGTSPSPTSTFHKTTMTGSTKPFSAAAATTTFASVLPRPTTGGQKPFTSPEPKIFGSSTEKVNSFGLYRIHRLVGLLPGLSEKVGLERVLEFQVHTPTKGMFLAEPYVDSEVGDLVLHLNTNLEGSVTMVIKGFDCSSVDRETGLIQESSNELRCVVQVKTALGSRQGAAPLKHSDAPRPRAFSNSLQSMEKLETPPAPKREQKRERTSLSEPFSFPLDNPYTLFYEEVSQTSTEFRLKKYRREQQKKKQLSKAMKTSHKATDLEASTLSEGDLNAFKDTPLLNRHEQEEADAAQKLETENLSFRSVDNHSPWFTLGTLQQPIGHFRLTAWQQKFIRLFANGNEGLFRTEIRIEVKKSARRDLRGVLYALGNRTNSLSGSIMSRRKSSKRSSIVTDAAAVEAASSPEKRSETIKKLILCLLLEENRNSRQLYADITELCDVYVTSAYTQTVATSGGSRDHLQRKAATIIMPEMARGALLGIAPTSPKGRLGGKAREEINTLIDALELAMVATFSIGCYAHCCQYALQRVHAVCVREQDTTIPFNNAQEDLAETYLWNGDGKNSLQVAEDVLMLAEGLHGRHSIEAVRAALLLSLASISCTDGKRAGEVLIPLYESIHKGEVSLPPHWQAQVHIAVAYTRPNIGSHQLDQKGLTPDSVIAELNRAYALLRGDGDLAEMDKSFSTVLPGQVNNSISESRKEEEPGGGVPNLREEKRLRWNLLSWVGSMLVQHGQIQKGIKIIEDVVQELVLGQHRVVERRHRSEMAAILWVSISLWRCWAYPTEEQTSHVMLRRMTQRLQTVEGPMHPITSMAQLMFAYLQRTVPYAGSLTIASKAMQYLNRTVNARSPLLLYAHRINCILSTISLRWRHAIGHANSALQIAMINGCYDETLSVHEEDLIGSLLRTPHSVTVVLSAPLFEERLLRRLESLARGYGASHFRLLSPLVSLSCLCYLQEKYDEAFQYAQRAIRVLDPKGLLHVTQKVLLPANLLPISSVQQRDHLVKSNLQTAPQIFRLTQFVYFMAAILVAQKRVDEALDYYLRCLALLECAELDGSLSSIHVMRSIAKLLYTEGEYGEALGWATTAAEDTRRHYGSWPLEGMESNKLLMEIENILFQKEGYYVTINQWRPTYEDPQVNAEAHQYLELI